MQYLEFFTEHTVCNGGNLEVLLNLSRGINSFFQSKEVIIKHVDDKLDVNSHLHV